MASYRQDMPPPGGYKDIEWAKVTRKRVSGYKILGALLAMKAVGVTLWYFERKRRRLELREEFDSRIAILPFAKAEDDRVLLKQCIKMRDAERELMKDNPNWEVGKFLGKQVYHNEQHNFDALLRYEFDTHVNKVKYGEMARVALGLNSRFDW